MDSNMPWTPEELKTAARRFQAEDPSMYALFVVLHEPELPPWALAQFGYLGAKPRRRG